MHDNRDGRGLYGSKAAPDSLGVRTDIAHRFQVNYGLARGSATQNDSDLTLHELEVGGSLVAMPGYLRPGRFDRLFADGNFTSLRFRLTSSGEGVGTDFEADTTALGFYRQNIDGQGVGYAALVGVSVALLYRRETYRNWHDRIALFHLPGLATEIHWLGRGWQLHVAGRLWGDFVGINAAPFDLWRAANPDPVVSSVVQRQGYYYGWGVTGRATAELRVPYVSLGGEAMFGHYGSHEGRDRFPERITRELAFTDTLREYSGWLRLQPTDNLFVEASAQRQERVGVVETFRTEAKLTRFGLRVGTTF